MSKILKWVFCLLSLVTYNSLSAQDVIKSQYLSQEGALRLAEQAKVEARKIDKNVSVAVLNSSGETLLLLKGDNVGPHNTDASRKKAYTSVSTKMSSWDLMNKVNSDPTAHNLKTISDLLLLGGGVPIWHNGILVGSIGVSGGGSGKNDHDIAMSSVENLGFKTDNK
ncbi:MAG: GlcG/HbpS family heme-binding protein [Bacteroidales bacterium]